MASAHARRRKADAASSHADVPAAASASRPETADNGSDRAGADRVNIVWLKKRKDFVRTQRGRAWRTSPFVLTVRARDDAAAVPNQARFGCTVTKRIGNAVRRNRVKRRLREAIRLAGPGHARPGYDYVLIARSRALDHGFAELTEALAGALEQIHAKTPQKRGGGNHDTDARA